MNMLNVLAFLATLIVSLYPQEIRGLIATPSDKARGWWSAWNRERYVRQLVELKKLHGNAYELLLFALTPLGVAGLVTLFAVLVYFSAYVADSLQHHPFSFAGTVPVDISFIGGMWSGQVTKVFITAARLNVYDKIVPQLEKRIAELSAKRA
jgi:hypothetical protein